MSIATTCRLAYSTMTRGTSCSCVVIDRLLAPGDRRRGPVFVESMTRRKLHEVSGSSRTASRLTRFRIYHVDACAHREAAMTIDRYTKTVLTVIAACLVWIAVGGPSLMTAVSAQGDAEFRSPRLSTFGTLGRPAPPVQAADPVGDHVILAGWRDQYGNVRPFADPY